MTDRISLLGLRVFGYHGVYDHERRHGQEFVVDLDLEVDLAPAAASDDVADTVHYGELSALVAGVISGEPVNLLETLAARIAGVCLSFPGVIAATVTVHKPEAPIAETFADVAVRLRRTRAELADAREPA